MAPEEFFVIWVSEWRIYTIQYILNFYIICLYFFLFLLMWIRIHKVADYGFIWIRIHNTEL